MSRRAPPRSEATRRPTLGAVLAAGLQEVLRGAQTDARPNLYTPDKVKDMQKEPPAPYDIAVRTQDEFEMPSMVYKEFDFVDGSANIADINRKRFRDYLEKCVKPTYGALKDLKEDALLEKFEDKIGDMTFWMKKSQIPVKKMIMTFRAHTFWLSNMFPSVIAYDDASELHDGEKIEPAVTRMEKKILKIGDLPAGAEALPLKAAVKAVHALVTTIRSTFPPGTAICFASVEHAFMAQKVKVADLVDEAATQLGNGDDKTIADPVVAATLAQKANDAIAMFERIRLAENANEAKKIATFRIKPALTKDEKDLFYSTQGFDRSEWAQINKQVMARALAKKFVQFPLLVKLLRKLGEYQILEGNYFGDDLWGCAFTPAAYADLVPLVLDPDGIFYGVLRNTAGVATVVRGQNWLGKSHMALATRLERYVEGARVLLASEPFLEDMMIKAMLEKPSFTGPSAALMQ